MLLKLSQKKKNEEERFVVIKKVCEETFFSQNETFHLLMTGFESFSVL